MLPSGLAFNAPVITGSLILPGLNDSIDLSVDALFVSYAWTRLSDSMLLSENRTVQVMNSSNDWPLHILTLHFNNRSAKQAIINWKWWTPTTAQPLCPSLSSLHFPQLNRLNLRAPQSPHKRKKALMKVKEAHMRELQTSIRVEDRAKVRVVQAAVWELCSPHLLECSWLSCAWLVWQWRTVLCSEDGGKKK